MNFKTYYMKYVFSFLILLSGFYAGAQSMPAEEVAARIAKKMKDSLALSSNQQEQAYEANLQLHSRKMQARQQYAGTDSIGIHIQHIENSRDSAYRVFLTPEQYQAYRQKKRNLISNN